VARKERGASVIDVEAYLRRIRYQGQLAPDAATLWALHVAHLEIVPFENFDIHLGRPIVLDEDGLFDKIVTRRRGGFCYELNGLFSALLRELGFRVTRLSAGVMRADDSFGPDFDHMTLMVELEDRWLADVGFGDSFREPLRLDDRGEQVQDGRVYQIRHDTQSGIMLRLNGGTSGGNGYRFSLIPRGLADYAEMCRYHQTSPESPFTQRRICSLFTPHGRITLSDFRLIVTERGDRRERLLTEEEWGRALKDRFGFDAAEIASMQRRGWTHCASASSRP
jgi:N-hydroxyarylamine O-acetyltransferase